MAETPTRRFPDNGPIADVFHGQAGAFAWHTIDGLRWLYLMLPEPAGFLRLPVHRAGETDPRAGTMATWMWDGNEDRPTITPSIHTFLPASQDGARPQQELWHGFLTAGVLRSC